MRTSGIDHTESSGRGSVTSERFRNSWKRDSFFVTAIACFDLALGCSIMLVLPSVVVLVFGVVSACLSTTGIFGAYSRNLKAMRIFYSWKIMFAFIISALIIFIAADAQSVCIDYLSNYEISNCQAKLGLLAIFGLIVDAFFAAYCIFVIKRFAKTIPHINLTRGCRSCCVDTSYLRARRSKARQSITPEIRLPKRATSGPSDSLDLIRHRTRQRKGSCDVSDTASSCSSNLSAFSYGTFRSDSV